MNKENIIKTIKYENLSTEELTELNWLLNQDQYKERPVTIDEFCDSDDFIHKKWNNIFPLWRQTLREIFPTPFNAPYNEILISAAAGSGKCLAKGTPILMYDGTIKNVEDIKVGDQIMGDDSTPRNVLSTCTGRERMYDVVPTRGGITWGCNESHILSLKCSYEPSYKSIKYVKNKVDNISVKDYLNESNGYKHKYHLYRTAIDFPNPQPLEIDPYIYGLWLGDGSTNGPALTNVDKEIIDIWCNYAKDTFGLQIREEYQKGGTGTYYAHYENFSQQKNPLRDFFKKSTVTGHKRILHEYKTASRENRLKLLAGIIDTDGYKVKGSEVYEICTKYRDLAEDYSFIAGSLGFRTKIREANHHKLQNGRIETYYTVSVAGEISQIPVVLERKKSKREFRDGDPLKTSFQLVDKGIGDYYGFTIDGNHLFVLGDFTVTHNTVTATISVLYDLYKLGCLKDPCKFYNLANDTMIIMAIFSATAGTATVNWNDITTGIESCPWINEKVIDRRGLEKKYGSIEPVEILKGLYIQTGSRFQHSMGKAIFDGLMDEAAFGGTNLKESQKTYNELSSRMKTRFSTYSETGNIPGHLFLISSPKEAGDFMQHRIEESKKADAKFTKIMMNISSWDSNPNNDSDDKFTVFIGNENKEPCIYDPDEEVPLEEMDDLIYPPMRYYEEFKKDLLISIMNYGGITTTSDMALFKSPILLNSVFVLDNPFYKDVVELPFATSDKTLMDFCDLSYFKDIRHPEYNRFIHIDAAYSTNTLDVYGLAAGYCVEKDVVEFSNETIQNPEDDIFSKKDREYFVDFAVGITAPHGQEVNLTKVQDFIEYLIRNCNYPVACITADQFQSKQTLQNLQNKGFNTDYVSVDRSRDPYLFLRYLIHNRQILLAKNEYLKYELKKLRDDGKKIDHPVSCFTGDTKIQLVDGRSVSIDDLLLEQQYKQNWVYTFNEQTKKIEPKRIKNIWQTKITKDLVKVTLDNGEVITCTPDHRFMLRDGSYEEIQNLTPGTSLMPLYTKLSSKGLNGYRLYYEPMEDKWHYEHRVFGNPTKERNIVHHCNYNKLDNTPTNLKPVTKEEHTTIHNNQTRDYDKISNSVKQWHERIKGTEEQKQISEKISKKVINSLTPEQKQKRQNKLDFIKGLEQYYGVVYEELTQKERQSYGSKYIAIAHPEVIEHHREAIKQAHKDGKYAHRKGTSLNRYWITNGIINKYIPTGEEIPQGFYKGRTFSKETLDNMKKANSHASWTPEQKQAYSDLQRGLSSNRIWVTNGVEDKYITKDSTIPEGFKPGRCKVGKNHKIVSIEYITKPCKVYDLEIEDNHNFALATGVFVHNCHKDVADAVAGAIWKCANSTDIINKGHVVSAVLNKDDFLMEFSPNAIVRNEQSMSLEMDDFERLKEQFSNGIFKGL